jgi:hypothetical protein
MPEFAAEIDIDPDEYVSECSSSEIKQLIKALIEDGHIMPHMVITDEDVNLPNILDKEWDVICEKIRQSRLVIPQSDEDTIREIFKKL